ncbi:MAG TPA: energy transducer TonB [Giesbergeria sp.]|nr:energy transducer TonB [Giesbergeria sp.]
MTYEEAPPSGLGRNTLIAIGVVLLHVVALWALHTGLLRRAVEVIVPAVLLSEFVTPPAPVVAPEPPPPLPSSPKPQTKTVRTPTPRPAPAPLPVTNAPPSDNAPVVSAEPPAPSNAPSNAPVTAAPVTAPEAPPAPARIEEPSSNAAYLQNPAPTYPAISKRMGEQGKVVLRVFIGTDGLPQKIELNRSSGFERLDRQAQETVSRWKFVPGKRNGVPEAMWYLVPINFVLE